MSHRGPFADIWFTLAGKGYVDVTVATHRVDALIETIKKRKWRQNVRRRKQGMRPYEDMIISTVKLSDAYVKVTFQIPQRYVV